MLPSKEEFAALVAAYPDVPEMPQMVSATYAAHLIGISESSIRIPAAARPERVRDAGRFAPAGAWRQYRLGDLVKWRAELPGRESNPGRPPVETAGLLAELRKRLEGTDGRVTVAGIRKALADRDVGRDLARRLYVELTGEEPARGRAPARK